MNTRHFTVRGDISCFYAPEETVETVLISDIEVQLWHKSPMEITYLGNGFTDSNGVFNVEFQVESPVSYIVEGKISDVFLKAFYKGKELDINNGSNLRIGLVSYWEFDGNSIDSVAANDGTDVSVVYSFDNGKINKGAGFNGTSSGVTDIGNVETFSFIQNTAIFTIAFWMKSNDYTASMFPVGNTDSAAEKGLYVAQISDGSLRIYVLNGSSITNDLVESSSGTGFNTDNDWHHIAIVVDKGGNTITFYKDAVAFSGSGTVGNLSSGDSNNKLAIGRISSGSFYFDGALDEFGIWERALLPSEINQLYNGGAGRQYPFNL